jgi:hypothetical protein
MAVIGVSKLNSENRWMPSGMPDFRQEDRTMARRACVPNIMPTITEHFFAILTEIVSKPFAIDPSKKAHQLGGFYCTPDQLSTFRTFATTAQDRRRANRSIRNQRDIVALALYPNMSSIFFSSGSVVV